MNEREREEWRRHNGLGQDRRRKFPRRRKRNAEEDGWGAREYNNTDS